MSIDREADKEDVVHIYNGILLSHKKEQNNVVAATWMQLEIIILSEVSQTEKTNTIWYHLYVESKIWHKGTYLWNRNRITDIENRLVVAKGEGVGGGKKWEVGVSRCKLLYIKWINKVLLYSTENYIQYPMINHDGIFKKNLYVCITESLCCIAKINTTLYINNTSIKNIF